MGKAAVFHLLPEMPLWRSLPGSRITDLSPVVQAEFWTRPLRRRTPAGKVGHAMGRRWPF